MTDQILLHAPDAITAGQQLDGPALGLLKDPPQRPLPEAVPLAFRQLRPLIHKGWEMVLVAAELGR